MQRWRAAMTGKCTDFTSINFKLKIMNKTSIEFKGKAIYQPSGKAAEYSKWACNLYNGCTGRCTYCYNRHGITAKILGADFPTLKKSLINTEKAGQIFTKELDQNVIELQKHGLHFNFVSDPCLKETYELNKFCIYTCLLSNVPVKILTKQVDWIENDLLKDDLDSKIWGLYNVKHLFAIGFTLTGHDEEEPGCSPNNERIRSMKVLHDEGFKTWASIEPIIDINSSMAMVKSIRKHVDLVKVGLKSGAKYSPFELRIMYRTICALARQYDFMVYFKDSFIKVAKIEREDMQDVSVTSDYNIFSE